MTKCFPTRQSGVILDQLLTQVGRKLAQFDLLPVVLCQMNLVISNNALAVVVVHVPQQRARYIVCIDLIPGEKQ